MDVPTKAPNLIQELLDGYVGSIQGYTSPNPAEAVPVVGNRHQRRRAEAINRNRGVRWFPQEKDRA